MRIGVLKETKDREMRVALLPSGARTLVHSGHEVFLESGAGEGSGFADAEYEAVGAKILETPEEVIAAAELVTKVKEPTVSEISAMRPGQGLFDFLHLAPDPVLTRRILELKVKKGFAINQEEAEKKMRADMKKYTTNVSSALV